ncbi:transcriptional regulator [Nitrosopumilus sp.]|uniref:transcriptional regulator n=1 Tax=Nitrosopumilus sp. TaxID=2024843 RepID=UPI0026017AB6|nr:transcriptional regulator [Nitrosopumilus sp.]
MAKKKDSLIDEAEKIKAELDELKKKKKVLDSKKTTKKAEAKPAKKTTKKAEAKPAKEKKLTKKEIEEAKKEAEKTLEEELEEQLSDEEIENFQIEKVDMERLTNKVCDILAERESDGMFQSELWKKLKLTSRDGSRLALKLERMGTINREKILEKGRWTYKLILKKTPISTQSIENAPCLVCPVEQKCSLEGEISPRNCQFIEDWVIAEMKKPAKAK